MSFKRIIPPESLSSFIECYWIIENNNPAVHRQKIIPDGYPEIIIHYKDPYRININKKWEAQSKYLVAGQITKHFYLENTGATNVFGIKLKPQALTHLFEISMNELTDKVISIDELNNQKLKTFVTTLSSLENEKRVAECDWFFVNAVEHSGSRENLIDKAIDIIFKCNGSIEINQLCKELFISERQLQRLFKKYIGVPPKIYARIIRFNYIFQLMKNSKPLLTQMAFDAGYYDQSHFVRNFKDFTGEEPSGYFFDEKNLANFFLKKTDQ